MSMSEHSLRSAIKLTRKALVELKLSSKLVTDRTRRQDIELKIKSIEKLLDRAEDKTSKYTPDTPNSGLSSKRFAKLNLEPEMLVQIEKKLQNIKKERAGDSKVHKSFGAQTNSATGFSNNDLRYQKSQFSQPSYQIWLSKLLRPFQSIKSMLRGKKAFEIHNRQKTEKPY